jgi:ubiquinone/menaquinone biosynthesis C-methylase UbiE
MNIDEFYKSYDEDSRLEKDNVHKCEYIISRYWIDKHLKKDIKILEIGAGTGRYSINLANEGYNITSVELLKYNFDILNSKIRDNMNIKTYLGNATDLSMLKDETYDLILCLGPLYHLQKDDIEKCIYEALRVAKKGAILFFAYLPSNFAFVKAINETPNYLTDYESEYKNNFNLIDSNDRFLFIEPDEIEKIMKNCGVEKINHVTTNGISRLIKDKVNSFSEKEFNVWIDYLKHTSDNTNQLGYGQNSLFIGQKSLF